MLRRATSGFLLLSILSCTTLRPVADTNNYLTTARPSQVWVLTNDGQRAVLLDAPQLFGDTLVGFVSGRYREFVPGGVREVRTRQPAPRRTLLMASAMVLVGAIVLGQLSGSGPGGSLPTPEDDPSNPRP